MNQIANTAMSVRMNPQIPTSPGTQRDSDGGSFSAPLRRSPFLGGASCAPGAIVVSLMLSLSLRNQCVVASSSACALTGQLADTCGLRDCRRGVLDDLERFFASRVVHAVVIALLEGFLAG